MKQPTEEIYNAALARLENGFSLGDVIRYFGQHPLEYEIPKTTLHRRWEKHRNSKSGTAEQYLGTAEQQSGTGGAEAFQAVLPTVGATTQNSVIDTGNAVSERSEQAEQRSETGGTVAFFKRHFSLMHLVFYTTSGAACYSMWNALPNILGGSMLLVFALFSLDSLLKAQNGANPRMAEYGRNRVIASELVAAVFHYRLLYKSLLENKDSLPFRVFETLKPGDVAVELNGVLINSILQNEELIIYISIGISALFFVSAFAAVDSVLQQNKHDAKN